MKKAYAMEAIQMISLVNRLLLQNVRWIQKKLIQVNGIEFHDIASHLKLSSSLVNQGDEQFKILNTFWI